MLNEKDILNEYLLKKTILPYDLINKIIDYTNFKNYIDIYESCLNEILKLNNSRKSDYSYLVKYTKTAPYIVSVQCFSYEVERIEYMKEYLVKNLYEEDLAELMNIYPIVSINYLSLTQRFF